MKYLKFEANWCGACKMIKPILRRVEEAGIPVEIVNAEFSAELVTQYNVKNLPTVILVDDSGKEFHRFTGTKAKTEDYLNTYQQFTNG
jgi:thiol-disulfide isomerase/thioredoxin